MALVVDTNVAIAANGRDTHAGIRCRLKCMREIRTLVEDRVVAVDDKGLIIQEYKNHLNFSGAPGVGDAFLRHVFNSQYLEGQVRQVAVTPSDDDRRGFAELPENSFDPSDRKFLAVAVVANAVVLNATDSDWSEHHELMDELGVEVEELCPHELRARRGGGG